MRRWEPNAKGGFYVVTKVENRGWNVGMRARISGALESLLIERA